MKKIKELIKKKIPYALIFWFRDFVRKLISYFYIGNKYRCVFCDRSFSKMMSSGFESLATKDNKVIGSGFRLNSKCPCCDSTDRERLLYIFIKKNLNYIFEKTEKSKTTTVLHIAPEKNLSKLINNNNQINYITSDLHSPYVDLKMNIENILFKDNVLDLIICNHVLEHVQNDLRAMSEFYRVLKKGGFAILQVPIFFEDKPTYEDFTIVSPASRLEAFGQEDHLRIYGSDYKNRLEKSGFKVNLINIKDILDDYEINKNALLKNEIVFFCQKI